MTHDDAVIVLGGGIAGLAAAYRARDFGHRVPIFEAAERAGGLLDSFALTTPEGEWIFDNAVHLSFATEPEVRNVFDRTPYLNHEARSLNWDDGYWLPHPVQNNMFVLPAEQKTDLIANFAEHVANTPMEVEIDTYRDWLMHQYGEKIAERWPLRYTRKYWTLDAEKLGTKWIGSRMRRADLRELLMGAMSPRAPNTYYISTMRYPEQGGYRAFLKPLLDGAELHCGHQAVEIDNCRKTVHFGNGKSCSYSRLIATIPLPRLIELMIDVPEKVREAASGLFATAVDIVSIGIRKPDVSPSLWFYIYDEDTLAARVYSPSWKSPNNAPAGHSSLQFEIYSSPVVPQTREASELIENCLVALEKMKLVTREDIIFTHHKRLPYGNVVFDRHMEERRDLVRDWVRSQDVYLAGRFGEWDYLWSNQAFMSGIRATEDVFRSAETTI
ncbi:NAD(P)-binding protein [Gluconacetobacter azotocaptans]|uniref:NAD(P)-binding protein n=1 Tax=Gluconacetobacter azotocaptans TaxID=142834 RepID=A0A7W4JPT9_9PROT|nr:FAD-dependent oxidoreductase [Gluconacetobacter azotocaptans]MBB2188710.1 NAD(P)-binding protein [Gluconacetobacter azotocaptans]GBQ34980.1 hypothetical protein AA13594_3002 [Gluconacetobacter azotocaptans DSM 13594]